MEKRKGSALSIVTGAGGNEALLDILGPSPPHTHSHSLTHTLTLTHSLTHIHSHTLSHTYTLSYTLAHTLTLTHTLTLCTCTEASHPISVSYKK